MDIGVMLAYLFGIVILYMITRLMLIPLKAFSRLVINAIIGGLALVVLNIVGGFFDFNIGINPITALIVGLMGVPGVLLLIALRLLLA